MLNEKGKFWPSIPEGFVREFRIELLKRKDPWSKKSLPQAKGRVVITVQLENERGDVYDGISIPKDVAEKFLILGVP